MQQDQSQTPQNNPSGKETTHAANVQETAGSSQPQMVEQKGEIKNNDRDPGAGSHALANEGGEKE